MIAGWDNGILGTEGIPPMKPGGKRKLVIPPGVPCWHLALHANCMSQ